jgi:murein DD-endopeptidase MepM/ murein hydrolase activator NlpD
MCGSFLRAAGLATMAVALLLFAPILDSSFEPQKTPNVPPPAPQSASRVDVKLRRGDTLLSVLTRYSVKPPSAHDLIAKLRPLLNPRKLRSGNSVQILLHPGDKTVQAMEVLLDDKIVRAKATTQGWTVERRDMPFVRRSRVIHGTIDESLYQSGVAAGLAPEQVLKLAGIFEYDIDFFSDFKPGDNFTVVVEETRYADGRRVPRRVLAADVQADGKIHSAFHFVTDNGHVSYYDGEGKELRNSFLRAPLSFARISSPYSMARRHPIFRTLRPHQAIDYAAPAGTPVIAIGRGNVTFSGWRQGYGNCVEISHPGGYSSRYGHFSRVAAGIRRGAQVNAGDVIGFVGQTGHATGPHLHFEFLQGDKKINFLTVKIPHGERLAGAELQRFSRERGQRVALLRNQSPLTSDTPAGL